VPPENWLVGRPDVVLVDFRDAMVVVGGVVVVVVVVVVVNFPLCLL